jgi:hypothetical protein
VQLIRAGSVPLFMCARPHVTVGHVLLGLAMCMVIASCNKEDAAERQYPVILPDVLGLTGQIAREHEEPWSNNWQVPEPESIPADGVPPGEATAPLGLPSGTIGQTWDELPIEQMLVYDPLIYEDWVEPYITGYYSLTRLRGGIDFAIPFGIAYVLHEGRLIYFYVDDHSSTAKLEQQTETYGTPGTAAPDWALDSVFLRWFALPEPEEQSLYWANHSNDVLMVMHLMDGTGSCSFYVADIQALDKLVKARGEDPAPFSAYGTTLGEDYPVEENPWKQLWLDDSRTGVISTNPAGCGCGWDYTILRDGKVIAYIPERLSCSSWANWVSTHRVLAYGEPRFELPQWVLDHPFCANLTLDPAEDDIACWANQADQTLLICHRNRREGSYIEMIVSMDDFVWFLGEYEPLLVERLASWD